MNKFILIGLIVAFSFGVLPWKVRDSVSYASDEHGHDHEEAEAERGHAHGDEQGRAEGIVALSAEQIAAAGIEIYMAAPGILTREVKVPGKIVTAADRMAQIVPKVQGTVTEARKNLGDTVAKGEVMALIESREMAEAVAEYFAARRAEELARTIYNREKGLWHKKITAEQDYMNAKNASQEAAIRLDLARQKLQALGYEGEIDQKANTRFYEVKSPIAGRVIERGLTLGEYVDTTHSAYTVADLSIVWVETSIAPADLPFVKEGQTVTVTGSSDVKAQGKLIFLSPAVSSETRSAKAIVELGNEEGQWRPGEFTNAAIATSSQSADVIVPKDALQTIEGETVIFIRNAEGFEKRTVTVGRKDSQSVEITSGLSMREPVAVSGTFTLKAELGKSEAGHEH